MRGESENGHFDSGSILLLRLMCQQYIHILNDSFFLPVRLAQGQVLKFVLVPSIYIYVCVISWFRGLYAKYKPTNLQIYDL